MYITYVSFFVSEKMSSGKTNKYAIIVVVLYINSLKLFNLVKLPQQLRTTTSEHS